MRYKCTYQHRQASLLGWIRIFPRKWKEQQRTSRQQSPIAIGNTAMSQMSVRHAPFPAVITARQAFTGAAIYVKKFKTMLLEINSRMWGEEQRRCQWARQSGCWSRRGGSELRDCVAQGDVNHANSNATKYVCIYGVIGNNNFSNADRSVIVVRSRASVCGRAGFVADRSGVLVLLEGPASRLRGELHSLYAQKRIHAGSTSPTCCKMHAFVRDVSLY